MNLEVTVSHVQKTCQGCYQNSREKETHQFSTYLLIRDGQLQRNLQKTFATPKKSSAPCRSCGAGEVWKRRNLGTQSLYLVMVFAATPI
ncbi:hypothetical protein L5515_018581 [Caenorhabditis briggsae]|uniref:Uncharacterized protein n=1 Tax=Caenorhabditis briggsae TaxID=6238 RepID=A0AAE8ZZT0_CAEBR|nr:hypothetical protein L3Y34_012727 [Caenorhabditis briggsae]UMM42931.1 hypothetical protein L5515_018581 [Caenorhabditis briggsae]